MSLIRKREGEKLLHLYEGHRIRGKFLHPCSVIKRECRREREEEEEKKKEREMSTPHLLPRRGEDNKIADFTTGFLLNGNKHGQILVVADANYIVIRRRMRIWLMGCRGTQELTRGSLP